MSATKGPDLYLEDDPCQHVAPTMREYAVGALTLFSLSVLLSAAGMRGSAACSNSDYKNTPWAEYSK